MFRQSMSLFAFILVVAVVSATTITTAQPVPAGLWRLDGNADDSSGNGNHGTLVSNPQWVEGQFGGALRLDGVDDYVETGTNLLPSLGDFTISLWLTVDGGVLVEDDRAAIEQGPIDSGGDRIYLYSSTDFGEANGQVRVWSDPTAQVLLGPDIRGAGWKHLVLIRSGNDWELYVDGTLYSTGSNASSIPEGQFFIGGASSDGRYHFGQIDEVHVYARALTEQEIQTVMEGPPPPGLASEPIPDDGATNVSRDVTLSWTPGAFAPATNGHIVYFSESFDDVSAGIGGVNQSAASYTPSQPLHFETTYYWRVDEVNAPPDSTVHEGRVWSFTTELAAYPISPENITAAASSDDALKGPQNAVDGSGLDETGLLHGNVGQTMWLSNRIGAQPTWIEFEFDTDYRLYEMWAWNSNESVEPMVGMGIKNATIEYSIDGIDYMTLGTTHEFAPAPGTPDYAHNTTIDMSGVTAKYVRITANDNWLGLMPQYGLSEVRFFYTPVQASDPYPASGATDVPLGPTGNPDGVTLSFAPGREAATHNLYLGTDEQAVIDRAAEVTVLTQANYGPLTLDLDTTYYWRVDEVNEAETPSTWEGPLWSFTTQEYFVVDDFESYNDLNTDEPESNRIFNVWIDGFGVPTNGSLVGYDNPPFTEGTIVHGVEQSMPFFYSNISGAAYSEAELTLSPAQDWTAAGVKTLSLWFYGDPDNTAAPLYVKVNGVKVTYETPDDLTSASWRPWRIDLASLDTNVQNVTTLAIGIDGNGAVGRLFVDDITLSPHERELVTPTEPDVAGLVAHYNLDQDARDSSANNIHGTVVGNPTWENGITGGAIQLDGRSDYIDCGNEPILDINTPMTISAWIYPTGAGISMFPRILDKSDSTDGAVPGYKMYLRAEENFIVTLSAGGAYLSTVSSVTLDTWNYVAFTVTGEQWRFYANGGWEQWTDSTLPSPATSPLFIGNSPVGDRHFYGMIDEVRIYERALTAAEITWLGGRTEPFDQPF